MATVTLEQIWAADANALAPLLESQGRKVEEDMRLNRVVAAIIYYNGGMLDAKDAIYVSDPKFVPIMRTVDNLQTGKELIVAPPEESEEEAAVQIPEGNEGLILHFRTLADLYTSIREEYKAKAFAEAATALEQLPYTLTLGNYKNVNPKGKNRVKGIGSSSYEEIEEFLKTNSSKRLESLLGMTASQRDVIKLFKDVYGIGTAKATELYKKGYRTIESLAKAPLTHAQKAGLKWYLHLKERIPRSEMDEWITRLTPILDPQEGKSNPWLVAGSYRRGEASSGDIDILMRNDTNNPNALSDAVRKLQNTGLLEEILALGDKKFMGIVRLGSDRVARRIDIRLFEPDVWAYALLYNTGSQRFNILCRQRAIDMGLTLNEYRLLNPATGDIYPAETEEDIFKLLGVQYLTPEQRTKDLAALTPL